MDVMGGIGGILQAFGALAGAQAGRRQADENAADRRARIAMAEQARRDSMLGTTDAHGNRAYFDPVRGWVTELTGNTKRIADQQLIEQLIQLFRDAPQRRRAEDANETERGVQRGQANALLSEFNRIRRSDPEAQRNRMYDRARIGINEGYDDAMNTAFVNALRTGNSNIGAVVAQAGRNKANDLRKASLDAAIQADEQADSRYNNSRNSVGNLYTAFSDRASRLPQTAYQPSDVTRSTTGNIPAFAGQAGGAANSIISAMASPDRSGYMAPANAITSIGSLFRDQAATNRSDDRNQQAMQMFMRMYGGG